MKVLDPGHIYELSYLDETAQEIEFEYENKLVFVKRFRDSDNHPGTTNQEVLRVLIDRVQFLHKEKPWEGNAKILHHLRMALILHETRALEEKVKKGYLTPELVLLETHDGHFSLPLMYGEKIKEVKDD